MPRTVESEPLQKHTLSFYQGDFERMSEFYPDLGASVAIRRIIRAHIRKLESGMPAVQSIHVEATL